MGKCFVCDCLNCVQWELFFEKNVSSDLQEKCFDRMKEIFKNVAFKDNTIVYNKNKILL